MRGTIRAASFAVVVAFGGIFVSACGPAPTAVYVVQPATTVPDVSGNWSTSWGGGETCYLQLQQNGASVSGSYNTTGAPPGTVNGTLNGNQLSGTWGDQGGGGGGMVLTFSPDGRSFNGTWGSGGSSTSGGSWSGTR